MIELKILTNDANELRIMGVALLELAKLNEGKDVVEPEPLIPVSIVDDEEIPAILKEQNPVEPEPEPEPTELDADGYPWDERIHSTAHSRNGDGTWKYLRRPKRFSDDDIAWKIEIKRVEAELRGENPDTPQDDPATVFGGVGADPQQNMAAEEQDSAGTTPSITFAELMKYVTSHKDQIGDFSKIGEICGKYGLNNLAGLQVDDSMIGNIHADIVALVEQPQ